MGSVVKLDLNKAITFSIVLSRVLVTTITHELFAIKETATSYEEAYECGI